MHAIDKIKVLIVYSDPLIAAGLDATLGRMREFDMAVGSAGMRLPLADVVITDYDSGLNVIAGGSSLSRRVLILTHDDREAKIWHALEQGVRGYLLLGCSLQDLAAGLRSIYSGAIALGPVVATRMADRMKQQPLTSREGDILRHMMLGMSNKAIASKLTVAVGTVKTHVKSVLEKLDASSRTEAVSIAQRRGILRDDDDGASRTLRRFSHFGRPLLSELHAPSGASRTSQPRTSVRSECRLLSARSEVGRFLASDSRS
jgi:DNA-binding NarL/FixJ family response regulator